MEEVDFSWERAKARRFGVWRYRELLPLRDDLRPVTLSEGGTPLIKVSNLYEKRVVNTPNTYVKFEGANPTGSFKDRGMTVGVTIAKSLSVDGVVVASTGNTAASAAAYAARAGLRCLVVLPKGGVAIGKLAQALLHGAEVREVEGTFDTALELVLESVMGGEMERFYPLNSYNPWRLEGQKTLAFEVVEELGEVPDFVLVPVGNAGNISAIWKGFKELYSFGYADKLPRMVGVQAEAAAPLAKAWALGLKKPVFVDDPRTIASAIRIGRPVNWSKAMRAVEESKGFFVSVDDGEILDAMRLLAREEGIGVEPASSVSLAALRRVAGEGRIGKGDLVVLVATGHALKDPDAMMGKLKV
ncbi:MAG: threonine synthase [Thermofilaceae archaeon]|nr:threonine synthase [Thermofilaceae archaeon]MCX8179872.1 threonine synthase [Thermofilaceae archaeon]MDW8004443.1 threonine synthase [Thermofilaceae archaeon]